MRALFVAIILLLLANVAFLNYKVFFSQQDERASVTDTSYNVVNIASPAAQKIVDSCYPHSCVDLIREATASLSPKTIPNVSLTSPSKDQEFYVSFGSGQTLSDEWEDVPGLSVYIDSTKYGKIKTVTFETSMRIPTANGRVYAQLFNVTDKHPVWFSEVSMEGNTSQLLVSSPITLDTGNKLYKVQMKTTLRFLSILDSVRVHIITE